ncbi:MAG: ABC transporter substrate-binding protein [Burkholderiaceae bacterium]|nr:ABC transporter substrate-binding protein [Burkholderiaceae bacterium]
MSMRKVWLAAAWACVFGVVGIPVQAQQTIKIGVNLERTGSGASYGVHMLLAAEIALAEINAAQGINGHKLELVIEDNRSSPEQAVIATRNLDSAGVFAMLGPIQSSQCRTAFPAANRAGLVAISTGSGAPGLTAKNRPWTFRNAAIDQIIIDEVVANLRKRYPRAKNVVAVVDPKDAYNSFLVKMVTPPALEKNGFLFVNKDSLIEIPNDVSDFSVFVTRIKAMNPDVVLLGLLFEQGQGFLREANRQKLNVPMFAGLGYLTETVAKAAGDIDLWAGQPFDPNAADSKVHKFVQTFKGRAEKEMPGQYSTPTYIDAGAYEAMYILADALREAKATPASSPKDVREKVRAYLAGLKAYVGLGNQLSINEEGDAVKPTLVYLTGGGRWVKQ